MATITQIEIDGFKAFPKSFFIDLEDGKNLLLYGENGSGKSSIYYALHVLFQSVLKEDRGAKYFTPGGFVQGEFIIEGENLININRFDEAKANSFQPYIKITFNDGKVWRINRSGLSSENEGSDDTIKLLNRESAFINHLYISRFNSVRNSEDINLWDVFHKDILSFYTPPKKDYFLSELYDEIISQSNKPQEGFSRKVEDFNQEMDALINKINSNLSDIYNDNFRFDGCPELSIRLLYLADDAIDNAEHESYYLFYGDSRHGIDRPPYAMFEIPKIGIRVEENGTIISKPQTYFNEARLTAIALAIRFACLAQGAYSGVLVLDDMLISLDMSNRSKLVEFLLTNTEKYKVYLFTHDRMFFEYFKHKTKKETSQWIYKEIYMDDAKCPYLRDSKTYLGHASHFIKQHEYEIAGNFLRKEAESFCRRFLPPRLQLSNDYSKLDLNGLIQNCRKLAIESEMPNTLFFDELDEHRKFILNPSSHDSYDVVKYGYEINRCHACLMALNKISIRQFLKKGSIVEFELKTPLPNVDEYKFIITICDIMNIIEMPEQPIIISKGMINYIVVKNGVPGKTQADNTTLKRFYDSLYNKSDKTAKSDFLDEIKESQTKKAIREYI